MGGGTIELACLIIFFNSFTSSEKPIEQLTLDDKIIKVWRSAKEIDDKLGFTHGNISRCCKHNRKQAYGFKWRYA